jgi:ABC-type amino acid transport system permease subunit
MFLVVGLFYFVVAFGVSQLAQRQERRTRSRDLAHSWINY